MVGYIRKIPNLLTILRVLLIPIFVVLLEVGTPILKLFAFFIFIVGAITDYADGYLARRYSATSDFGKLLDPVADKILVMAALVMLVSEVDINTGKSLVPAWLVVLILAREIWITGLRLVAVRDGIVVAADTLGKYKTALQMLGILLYLLVPNFDFLQLGDSLGEAISLFAFVSLIVSLVLSYLSGYQYTKKILGSSKLF